MKKRTLSLILMLCTSMTVFAGTLPEFGGATRGQLTLNKEKAMGTQFMQAVRSSVPLIHDPLLTTYINDLGQHIAANSDASERHFHFFIVANPTINAFAGPDGNIGFFSGLILTAQSQDELAAVVAHEIAHVSQDHLQRALAERKKQALTTLATIVAAAAAGAAGGGSAAAGAASAGLAGQAQSALTFSRAHEKEADAIGIRTLHRAGFNPNSMASIFDRMGKANLSTNPQLEALLSTHPVTGDRINEARSRAAKLSKNKPSPFAPNEFMFQLMHARLQVITSPNTHALISTFNHQAQRQKGEEKIAAQYGLALAYYKNREFTQANSVIDNLIKQYPQQTIFQMAKARILTAEKHNTQAIAVLHEAYEYQPDYFPLLMQYADTLLTSGKATKARLLLSEQAQEYNDNLSYNKLLARAQGESGQVAQAYQTRAKILTLQDNNQMALIQLQQALKLSKLNSHEKIQINAEIKTLKAKIKADS